MSAVIHVTLGLKPATSIPQAYDLSIQPAGVVWLSVVGDGAAVDRLSQIDPKARPRKRDEQASVALLRTCCHGGLRVLHSEDLGLRRSGPVESGKLIVSRPIRIAYGEPLVKQPTMVILTIWE